MMKTITFYSYKGGTGRTLAVANAAKFLAKFGQRVVVLDFDLEAPGLHYKLGLCGRNDKPEPLKGLVDFVQTFMATKEPPKLTEYVFELPNSGSGGRVYLLPA